MLELKKGDRGVALLMLAGYCGEFPVALLRKFGGYYDYNRRLLTKLVEEGYLKDRRLKGYDRHIVRSVSLTEKGLAKLRQLQPWPARHISEHLLAPADGQGDWKKTLRLHRSVACLLAAISLGAAWKPYQSKLELLNRELVYYGAYEIRKQYGMDNKGSRASGVLFGKLNYYILYYLGEHNMQWSQASEDAFREALAYSPIGGSHIYGGNIFIGEDWALAENLVTNGTKPYGRMIPAKEYGNYYVTLDEPGIELLRVIVTSDLRVRLQRVLTDLRATTINALSNPMFDLGAVSEFYRPPNEKKDRIRPTYGYFFDFQMEVMEHINNVQAQLVEIPSFKLYEITDTEAAEGPTDEERSR